MDRQIRLQLKPLRQARTMSQEELAKSLGVSRQSIIALEQGEYLPSVPLLISLLDFFSCTLDDLMEGAPIKIIGSNNQKGGEQMMQMTPWSPFQAIDRLQDEMSDLVDKTFGRADWSRALSSQMGAMNIHEDAKEYELHIQVPGFKEDEVNVELTEDTLTVSGSRQTSDKEKAGKQVVRREWEQAEFSRTIRFNQPIKADASEAKLENGTLVVVVPKVEPVKPKTTKITVKKK